MEASEIPLHQRISSHGAGATLSDVIWIFNHLHQYQHKIYYSSSSKKYVIEYSKNHTDLFNELKNLLNFLVPDFNIEINVSGNSFELISKTKLPKYKSIGSEDRLTYFEYLPDELIILIFNNIVHIDRFRYHSYMLRRN